MHLPFPSLPIVSPRDAAPDTTHLHLRRDWRDTVFTSRNIGIIAGIASGIVALILIVVFAKCWRKRRTRKQMMLARLPPPPFAPTHPHPMTMSQHGHGSHFGVSNGNARGSGATARHLGVAASALGAPPNVSRYAHPAGAPTVPVSHSSSRGSVPILPRVPPGHNTTSSPYIFSSTSAPSPNPLSQVVQGQAPTAERHISTTSTRSAGSTALLLHSSSLSNTRASSAVGGPSTSESTPAPTPTPMPMSGAGALARARGDGDGNGDTTTSTSPPPSPAPAPAASPAPRARRTIFRRSIPHTAADLDASDGSGAVVPRVEPYNASGSGSGSGSGGGARARLDALRGRGESQNPFGETGVDGVRGGPSAEEDVEEGAVGGSSIGHGTVEGASGHGVDEEGSAREYGSGAGFGRSAKALQSERMRAGQMTPGPPAYDEVMRT